MKKVAFRLRLITAVSLMAGWGGLAAPSGVTVVISPGGMPVEVLLAEVGPAKVWPTEFWSAEARPAEARPAEAEPVDSTETRLENLEDPTRPMDWSDRARAPEASRRPVVTVDAIFLSGGRRMARINGSLVGEGQQVGDIRLVGVERHRVTLQWRGEVWAQALGQLQNQNQNRSFSIRR